ncbi:LOW QUALITY PROTEIN: hypothetical protein OSB04_000730 [Centaurea solstitialis]|uniref:Uncharacterized protein n=1 Tax=Centaurea solstitialis TaxID=347529 RepID=A0AA38TPW8_9ASTR|nr:LOW QUALITY PROTEIN: hypothetical protein OSB04_000730 [Centaurea solstitialis]
MGISPVLARTPFQKKNGLNKPQLRHQGMNYDTNLILIHCQVADALKLWTTHYEIFYAAKKKIQVCHVKDKKRFERLMKCHYQIKILLVKEELDHDSKEHGFFMKHYCYQREEQIIQKFCIPLDLMNESTCEIRYGAQIA